MGAVSAAATPVTGRPRPEGARARWRSALWGAIAVAVCAGIALGAGAFRTGAPPPASLYQRTMDVAGEYRCPVCAGESVAASDAPEAIEIKGLVRQWLAEGRSSGQIRSYLVKDYGSSILERPPASGVGALVWALPGVAVAAGLVGLGLGFARWRRANLAVPGPDVPGVGVALVPPRASPGPAPAGATDGPPVTDRQGGARAAGARRRWSGRVSLVAGTALVVVAGALWLLDRSATARLPGDTITGGQDGTSAALRQASALATTDPAAALVIYDEVLSGHPDQPEALTDEGWIYAQGGLVPEALARLDRAEKVDPSYDAAHLYRGLVLLDDQDRPGPAAAELKWYLAHGPSSSLVAAARSALAQAQAKG